MKEGENKVEKVFLRLLVCRVRGEGEEKMRRGRKKAKKFAKGWMDEESRMKRRERKKRG